MKARKLTEVDIKARLLSELRCQAAISKKSVIANEFRLGKSPLRADLAILSERFIGVEIKSELDSLRRLEAQVRGYVSYFDRVIVVLASKHLKNLDWQALSGAEVWELDQSGNFGVLSVPFENPIAGKRSLIDLMTQQERRRYCGSGPKPESRLHTRSDQFDLRTAEQSFALAFRHRFERTSVKFWRAVGRRKIQAADLAHLSRFRDRRETINRWSETQAAMWQDWQLKARSYFGSTTPTDISPATLRLCYTPLSDHHKIADGVSEY